jgi:hypothetical protein
MPDPQIRRTLERDVLPYLVSARRLKRQWFYLLHTVFGYTSDLVVALAAIGVSSPLIGLLNTKDAGPDATNKLPSLASALSGIPPFLVYPAVIVIVAWVIIRVAFVREEGQKRAVLARSCIQNLREAQADLHRLLRVKHPLAGLTEMLEKRIRPTVDRNIQENSWPWLPFAPNVEADVRKELNSLCALFEEDWEPSNEPDLRALPKENKL